MSDSHSSVLGDLVARSARRVPDTTALVFADRRWTYKALETAANRVAAALLGLGLRRGDRVAAFAKNSDACVR